MKARFDRIAVNPEIMNGQPCIRSMRLTVRRVVEAVALYPDWEDLQAEYPELENADHLPISCSSLRQNKWVISN